MLPSSCGLCRWLEGEQTIGGLGKFGNPPQIPETRAARDESSQRRRWPLGELRVDDPGWALVLKSGG